MILLRLAVLSLLNRRLTAALAIVACGVSVALFQGVETVRTGAKESFANTVSGVDLIVGARSGGVQLLLYSVFRIGNATNNITWDTFLELADLEEVEWAVPLSLGDSHKGFRVLGTTEDYFERYRFRAGSRLAFADGKPFAGRFDAVVGADVARALGYRVGDAIVVSHGISSLEDHDEHPFTITGILEKTGTPVDRTVHVELEGIEAIHQGWRGAPVASGARARSTAADTTKALTPKSITAAMLGMKSRLATFKVQRFINEYEEEPLLAILPGVALQELWELVGVAETALTFIGAMVVAAALLGLATMILASLNERRREMAILRAVGAGPGTVLTLLLTEAALLSALGIALGMALLYAALFALRPYIDLEFGLYLPIEPPSMRQAVSLLAIFGAGILAGLVPAIRAYRMSVADGMTVRI